MKKKCIVIFPLHHGYANGPQCYVIRTLPILSFSLRRRWGQNLRTCDFSYSLRTLTSMFINVSLIASIPALLAARRYRGLSLLQGVKLTIYLHPMPELRKRGACLHSPVHLHRMTFNYATLTHIRTSSHGSEVEAYKAYVWMNHWFIELWFGFTLILANVTPINQSVTNQKSIVHSAVRFDIDINSASGTELYCIPVSCQNRYQAGKHAGKYPWSCLCRNVGMTSQRFLARRVIFKLLGCNRVAGLAE